MAEYNVGPGVQAAIDANGDTARSDERFIILDEGRKVSLTFADLATYYWYEETNRVNRAPFLDG